MALFRGVVSGTKNRPHRALSDRIKRVTHRRVGRCCSTTSTSRVRSRVDRSGAQNIPGCAGPDLSKRFGCFEGLGVRRPISCPPTKRQLPRALKRYRLFVCLFVCLLDLFFLRGFLESGFSNRKSTALHQPPRMDGRWPGPDFLAKRIWSQMDRYMALLSHSSASHEMIRPGFGMEDRWGTVLAEVRRPFVRAFWRVEDRCRS